MELNAEQQRVLGCLIEKARTTPDQYPLTLNALRLACNQSTNRDPVIDYDEQTIEDALTELREHNLARRGVYPGSRKAKHKHCADEALLVGDAEQATLAVLLLRGPQTPGELKQRADRLYSYRGLDEVTNTLESLSGKGLVTKLGRQPGQKEARFRHTLGTGAVSTARTTEVDVAPGSIQEPGIHERVTNLEDELRKLRAELDAFRNSYGQPGTN